MNRRPDIGRLWMAALIAWLAIVWVFAAVLVVRTQWG